MLQLTFSSAAPVFCSLKFESASNGNDVDADDDGDGGGGLSVVVEFIGLLNTEENAEFDVGKEEKLRVPLVGGGLTSKEADCESCVTELSLLSLPVSTPESTEVICTYQQQRRESTTLFYILKKNGGDFC